jgi:hypothetical protein
MVIKVYVSSMSGNMLMRVKQDHIKRIFDSKKIPYEEIDVASPRSEKDKELMQEIVRKSSPDSDTAVAKPLPPQLFHGDNYRGDYEGFFEAVETESMYKYLGLEAPPDEVEYQLSQQQQTDQIQQQQCESSAPIHGII